MLQDKNKLLITIGALEAALKTQAPGTPGYTSVAQQLAKEKAKLKLIESLLEAILLF